MGIKKPYRRTCRVFTDLSYSLSGKSEYIKHPLYSENPGNFVRAFTIIQKDLISLFDYIEPADGNNNTYSFRIHELFLRSCSEIEANFKAILRENEYSRREELV